MRCRCFADEPDSSTFTQNRAGSLPETVTGANGQLRINGLFREDKGLGERKNNKKKSSVLAVEEFGEVPVLSVLRDLPEGVFKAKVSKQKVMKQIKNTEQAQLGNIHARFLREVKI